MANPSKRKGSKWETDLLTYMKAFAHLAGRRWFMVRNPPAGTLDVGDLHMATVLHDWVVECKAEQRINLAGYMKELADEQANWERREKKPSKGVVFVKRRNQPVGRGYAVMEVGAFMQLLVDVEDARG